VKPDLWQLFFLVGIRVRFRLVVGFWSYYYRLTLRFHPAVKRVGALQVSGPVDWRLDPRGEVTLGDVRINSGSVLNPVGGHRRSVIAVGKQGRLQIADIAGLSGTTICCHEAITIEEYVLIGGGCLIVDTDFHPLNFSTRFVDPSSQINTQPVTIKRGAFVGAHSIVMKGVTIGAGAVIGAGSVVARDIPEGEIWAGNPVRFIKRIGNPT